MFWNRYNYYYTASLVEHFPQKTFFILVEKISIQVGIMVRFFNLFLWKFINNKTFNLMLRWTIIFLVIAIIAAIFGFGGIAAGAASIAKILFFIFLVLFVLSLIAGGFRRVD